MESLPSNHVSYYDLLMVAPDSSLQTVKSAYHKLLLSSHPDKIKGTAQCKVDIPLIQEAYRVLSTQRAEYDLQLKEHRVISGVADGSGLDHCDLSSFTEEFKDGEYTWVKECIRCSVGSHVIRESQLEAVPIVDSIGVVAVQCDNCSLWVSVGFSGNE